MHRFTDETEQLARLILDYARERARMDPVPLDGPRSLAELTAAVGDTITADGLGGEHAFALFRDELAPAIISIDHPRYLSFIPSAPTEAAALFELVVGVSSIYGGSWLEASGAVYAENQALRYVADLAGLPPTAGGAFVQGATLGTLAALVTARHTWIERHGRGAERLAVAASGEAHSSVGAMARVMDIDIIPVETHDERMTGADLARALADRPAHVFAAVATAGTTNLGIVDDVAGVAEVCADRGIWLHVDGAYGGAALAAPSARSRFDGIERCDSLVVDPHKWLFAPYDCCALLYRRPELGRAALAQHAGYLHPIETGQWNPSDYGVNLTRRARGLPFWFSLATHGTRAYATAVEQTLSVARDAACAIRARDYLALVREPDLSVVAFERRGWSADDYQRWSARLLADGVAFVTPSSHRGRPITRLAIVNPRTTIADVELILDSMA